MSVYWSSDRKTKSKNFYLHIRNNILFFIRKKTKITDENNLFLYLYSFIDSEIGITQTNNNITILETFSNCDVSRMIANRINIDRDWSSTILESVNEFIIIIEGTNQYKYLGKINLDIF